MTTLSRRCVLAGLAAIIAMPAAAQGPAPKVNPTPTMLVIYREEVRPGRGPAHAANEAAWAAAFNRLQAPIRWLGMTSMAGPSEAWFLAGYDSFEAYGRAEKAANESPEVSAENDKHSALETDLVNRTSTIIARYREDLSYQPGINLPDMRYASVDIVRVKPGRVREFADAWRMMVEAHNKSKMDEHWAVYQVAAGMPDGTLLFFYPYKSLAEIDAAGPTHGGDAFRDAVGESGRLKMREMDQTAIEWSQTMIFEFNPRMSTLSKEWIDADPAFWAPKPAAPAARKPTEKR